MKLIKNLIKLFEIKVADNEKPEQRRRTNTLSKEKGNQDLNKIYYSLLIY